MMRRFGALCLSVLLFAAACSDSNGEDDDTALSSPTVALPTSSPNSTAASTVPVTLTTLPMSTTAPQPADWPDQPVLIVNTDGVFQLRRDGRITRLVEGEVAYAVDDTQGGLLFQSERGRWSDAYGEQPSTSQSTVVWWIPAGGSAAQELLVPTPGAGQYLSLHDAFPIGASFAVVYERHEGTLPFDTDTGEADMADRLRVFDVSTATVDDVYQTRGYEWWLSDVSAGDGLIAATEVQILGAGCRLFDAATGATVARPGFPSATTECFEETTECATSCAVAHDADRVIFDRLRQIDSGADWIITVADMDSGNELAQFSVPVSGRWGPAELDVAGEFVLLNRHWEGTYDQPAMLVDLQDPKRALIELPLAGRARFVTEPVDIAAPVAPPGYAVAGPNYYLYGDDGLLRVVDGIETRLLDDSVAHVWDDHMGGVIIADVTASEVLHLRAGNEIPTAVVRESGYADARFTGIVNDHPSLFFAGIPEGGDLDEWPCGDWSLNSRDLITGEERLHLCLPIEDADLGIRSAGDGLLVGAPYTLCGGTSTSTAIQFWDLDGNPGNLPANPFPSRESCAPCELNAMISPDGALLVYRHRPDSFSDQSPNYSGPACGGGAEQVDTWWQQSKSIPAQIAVVDLGTGDTLWEFEASADTHLSDFDGRYVVLTRAGQAMIYDTLQDRRLVEVAGNVRLRRTPG